MIPGKHCDFITYLSKRARAQSGACAEVQFPDKGTEIWSTGSKGFQESPAISASILQRERELSLAHEPRCRFLIMEYISGPLAVEMAPGKHCDLSTYIAKRARAQSLACAELQFPDYGTELWSPGSRNYSRKALIFQHLSCQESEISLCRMRRGAFS
jgi:hypothetical protein